jgi:ribosomal protein L39E
MAKSLKKSRAAQAMKATDESPNWVLTLTTGKVKTCQNDALNT